MESLLRVQNLYSGYGDKQVLKDISFELNQGEILGIVGESGSGKSTIFNSIIGLRSNLSVFSGEILYKEKDLVNMELKEKRKLLGKEIGAVFQSASTSLVPTRKIKTQFEETVKMKMNISDYEIKKKALGIFEVLRLENPELVYKSYPFELSGGMQQRVALALSIILEPDLLLCDEPTSALDVKVEYELVKELARLRNEKGIAILIITHNLALAKKLCDKIMVVFAGRIMEYRKSSDLIKNPIHPYTNNLINSIPKLLEQDREDVVDTENFEKLYCNNCHLIHAGGEKWEKVLVNKGETI